MKLAAHVLIASAAISFLTGCQLTTPATAKGDGPAQPIQISDTFAPSPRLIVGRVIAIDPERGFAFIELAPEAPTAAIAADSELMTRTLELRETARLRVSRQLRGRTLGTIILAGKPGAGDEVVWLAP